jgi:hypothetical protein
MWLACRRIASDSSSDEAWPAPPLDEMGFYVTHQVDRYEAAGADDILCEVGGEALDKI